MTDTWLIEVEFEDGEVFTHRTHKNPHDAGWECVFPTAVAVRFSPVPAQERQSESVAAPAEVGQGQGTITLESFQLWLENKARAARAEYFKGPQGETLSQEIERCRPFTDFIARTRVATELLMQFKLEQGV